MTDKTMYVFVRGDLPEEDQLVQACHAVFSVTSFYAEKLENIRLVALDVGNNPKSFTKAINKLISNGLEFYAYFDSDKRDWGVTAVATRPLDSEQAKVLSNYRLRKYSLGIEKPVCGVVADEGANAVVAQRQ